LAGFSVRKEQKDLALCFWKENDLLDPSIFEMFVPDTISRKSKWHKIIRLLSIYLVSLDENPIIYDI
jgi:hypothetical protein